MEHTTVVVTLASLDQTVTSTSTSVLTILARMVHVSMALPTIRVTASLASMAQAVRSTSMNALIAITAPTTVIVRT